MSTISREIAPRALRRQESQKADPTLMAAFYIGTMPGIANLPSVDLYNLLVPVGEHPVGSTVSRTTLEKHGIPASLLESESAMIEVQFANTDSNNAFPGEQGVPKDDFIQLDAPACAD